MNDNSKVLVALLAGVAAGAALGILFAPERGTETRDRLNDALKNLGDTIKDRAAEEIDNLSSLKEKIVENLKTTLGTAEDTLEEVKAPATEPA
ncbi:gas vesicle protein [Arcticibacter pallidicorallinus]|uniref:Gas vesicle protein n=1 Tax=Arcticibacter pallidicorallinus TaxID=1259464 RepID=A0A2T0U7Q6_9SPHI|nr:YtxH domain-containing protein [Arcticibacter pallidicorallinus]PRY53950.1 gas vesicle protein [Arcticibacter pallidicorallinus]